MAAVPPLKRQRESDDEDNVHDEAVDPTREWPPL